MRINSHEKRIISAVFTGLITLILTIQPAYAHTKLVSASPPANSVEENWPAQIILEFDEELQNLGPEKANFLVVIIQLGIRLVKLMRSLMEIRSQLPFHQMKLKARY